MNEIDKIIDNYFEGETSLQEEKILRDYFMQSAIEDRHKVYIPMFKFFAEEQSQKNYTPIRKKRQLPYLLLGITASILLMIGLQFVHMPSSNESTKTMVYVNGKKISDAQAINYQALISIQSISEEDGEVLNSQITILDSFID